MRTVSLCKACPLPPPQRISLQINKIELDLNQTALRLDQAQSLQDLIYLAGHVMFVSKQSELISNELLTSMRMG